MQENYSKNILIYRTKGIGDVILSFKGLELLQHYHVRVFYIGSGPALQLVNHFFPGVATIDIGNVGFFRSYRMIRKNLSHADAFIDLHKNSKSILIRNMLWMKFHMPVFSWNKRSLKRSFIVFLNRLTGRKFTFSFIEKYSQPSVESLMTGCIRECIEYLFHEGHEVEHRKRTRERIYDMQKKENKILVIAPGASHHSKHPPVETLVSIINKLTPSLQSKTKFILVGGEDDQALCDQVKDFLSTQFNIEDHSGKYELQELPAILSQADAVLASDSALAHLSAYLNIPTAVLMGPTVEGFGFFPDKAEHEIFSSITPCRPCSRHGDIQCTYHDKLCFQRIDCRDVANFLNNFLIPD